MNFYQASVEALGGAQLFLISLVNNKMQAEWQTV